MKSVAIVTGASQGIGAATAIRLAKDFDAIVLVARNIEKLNATAAVVKAEGAEALVLDLNLNDKDAADVIVTATIEKFGRIDALVNVAGDVPQIDLFSMTDEQWDAGMSLKFHGARRLTLRAWDELKKTRGAVILTSGNSATVPKAPYAAVGAINAAIVALAKAFSDRGITDGVQVNSVLPGPIMTSRRTTFLEKWAPENGVTVEEAKTKFLNKSEISRYGTPEEIADLFAYLVSPSARWLTGSAIRMDGGEVKAI